MENTSESPPLLPLGAKTFHTIIATLLFIAKRTRPDILKDVSFLATKSNNYSEKDVKAVLQVFRYVMWSKERVLVLSGKQLEVCMFVDASFMTHSDLKGHTGCIITLGIGGGVMSAISRKQKILTRSSTEAELVAIDDAYKHALFCASVLSETTNLPVPIRILEDNMSTIKLILKGESNNINTKHILLRYYLVKKELDERRASISYWRTERQLGDLLSKPLAGQKLYLFTDLILGDKDIYLTEEDGIA
jgi:uncharacterized protein with FMN-binding domain